MKTTNLLCVTACIALCGFMPSSHALELKSPDGRLSLLFDVKDFEGATACPVYSVVWQGRPIIEPSRMGYELESGSLKQDLQIVSQSKSSEDVTWKPVYGERSVIRDNYNQVLVELRGKKEPHRLLHITLRAYNQGAAFAYTIPKQQGLDRVTITKELTEFRLAGDYPAWATYSAQGLYNKVPLTKVRPDCERPLVIECGNDTYAALAEARLVDYARMKFAPLAGRPHSLVASLDGKVEAAAPMRAPWRAVMVASSPGELLENNDIILNLNDPCAIADTSWIKPGKVIREVTLTTIGARACIDFAAKHQLQYILFDAGWYGKESDDKSDATKVAVEPARSPGPLNLKEVIRYGKAKGVGVILYVNRRAAERQLDEILPLYHEWGVKGVKYGFVKVGPQQWTSWLHHAVRQAAKNQLMVDVHDEYRPTGYSRTYPNLMTVEGTRGDEEIQENRQALIRQFTRMLAGPADNTICYFNKRVDNNSSHSFQLAKAVCIYSPLQHLYWYDRPPAARASIGQTDGSGNVISEEPELEFFDKLPTVWDDTRVLAGSIGDYAVIARRSGKDWFVGCMNNDQERKLEVPPTFLDTGSKYMAHIYSDDPAMTTRTKVKIERIPVNHDTVLKAAMPARGGQAVRIVPAP